jgi:hypothetical protein
MNKLWHNISSIRRCFGLHAEKYKFASYCYFLVVLLMSFTLLETSLADETASRRLGISLSIFPKIVAVDQSFHDKLDDNKNACLLFVYEFDEKAARQAVSRILENTKSIGGIVVVAKMADVENSFFENKPPTAIFLVEKMNSRQLQRVMNFSRKTRRLVFSPFAGDVERGVNVGISITNRVKPYFNVASLRRSNIAINALLMKVSKRYE